MNFRLAHGLAYVEVTLTYRDRDLLLRDVILDTGSAGTVFSADRLGLDYLLRAGAVLDLARLELRGSAPTARVPPPPPAPA